MSPETNCREVNLNAIWRVYKTKGAKGLTQEAIDYYNECRGGV